MTNSITNCIGSSGSPAPAQASLMLSDCSYEFLLNRRGTREDIYFIKESIIPPIDFSFELANFKMQPNNYDEAKCPMYFVIKVFDFNKPKTNYTNIALKFGGRYEDNTRFNKFYIDDIVYDLLSSNIDYSKLKMNFELRSGTNQIGITIVANNDSLIFSGYKIMPDWYMELKEGSIGVAYSVVFGDPTNWISLNGKYDVDLLNSKLKYDIDEISLFFG